MESQRSSGFIQTIYENYARVLFIAAAAYSTTTIKFKNIISSFRMYANLCVCMWICASVDCHVPTRRHSRYCSSSCGLFASCMQRSLSLMVPDQHSRFCREI